MREECWIGCQVNFTSKTLGSLRGAGRGVGVDERGERQVRVRVVAVLTRDGRQQCGERLEPCTHVLWVRRQVERPPRRRGA
jgi:hypothetical protein